MNSPNISLEQIQNLKANLGVFEDEYKKVGKKIVYTPPGTLKNQAMKEQVGDYYFPWLVALIHDAEYAHAEWPKDNINA